MKSLNQGIIITQRYSSKIVSYSNYVRSCRCVYLVYLRSCLVLYFPGDDRPWLLPFSTKLRPVSEILLHVSVRFTSGSKRLIWSSASLLQLFHNRLILKYDADVWEPIQSVFLTNWYFCLGFRSVNEVICHGIPDQRPLQDGDILNSTSTLLFSYVTCQY